MNNNGFVSMAVIYTFIIVFLTFIVSLLSAYAFRNEIISSQVRAVKNELNEEY